MHAICTSFLFTFCTVAFNGALQTQPYSAQLTDQITLTEPAHRVLPMEEKHTDFSTDVIHIYHEYGPCTVSLTITTEVDSVYMVINERYITGANASEHLKLAMTEISRFVKWC
jgi:PKD repeat protein